MLLVRGAGSRWAVPLARVVYVGVLPPLTRLPHAPDPFLGATMHRGDIVPVLDFARLLGAADPDADRIALVRRRGQVIGLRLAAVEAVRRLGHDGTATLDLDSLDVPEPVARQAGSGGGAAWRREPVPVARERGLLARIGARPLWLRLAEVIEVLEGGEAIAVPWADPRVPEVVVRGAEVLPVVRLGLLLGLAEARADGPMVVAAFHGARVAFRVDAVDGLTERDPALAPFGLDALLAPLPDGGATMPLPPPAPAEAGAREGAFLAIVLAGQTCLLPLRDVGAVADHVRPTALPAGAPAHLVGVRAIGGHIVPVIDPRAALGLPTGAAATVDVVVEPAGASRFVVQAQHLDGVIRLDRDAIHATGRGAAVLGVARLASHLAWLLSPSALAAPRGGA